MLLAAPSLIDFPQEFLHQGARPCCMPDTDIFIGIVGVLLSVDQALINNGTVNVVRGHSFQAYDIDITVVFARLVFICCMILEIQLIHFHWKQSVYDLISVYKCPNIFVTEVSGYI